MTPKYSIAEARSRLRAIVEQVEAGGAVELTRRGKPVAVMLSRGEFDRLQGKRRDFSEAYQSFLKKHPLDQEGLEEDLAPKRDSSGGRKVSL